MHVRVKGSDPLIMSTLLLTRRETGFIFTPGWGKKCVCVCVFCFSFLKQKTSLEIRQIKIRQFWMVFQSQDCAMLTTGAAPFVSTNSD